MIGQACAMLGAASWQILASVLKMPVSGTHSIVGAVLGFALVANKGVEWIAILKIGQCFIKMKNNYLLTFSCIMVCFTNFSRFNGGRNVQDSNLVHSVNRQER